MTRIISGTMFYFYTSSRRLSSFAWIKVMLLSFLIILFLSSFSFAQDTIWFEGFNYPYGTTDPGNGKWSIDVSDCDFLDGPPVDDDHFEVRNNEFSGNDLDGLAIWTSEIIDISAETDVKIKVDLWQRAFNGDVMEPDQDTMFVYFKLDGGPEVQLSNGSLEGQFGDAMGITCGPGFNGNTLQIIIKARNTFYEEFHYFDNILVYSYNEITTPDNPPNTLWAVANGIWEDANTWSTTNGGTPGDGGVPTTTSDVRIGCGYTVSLTLDNRDVKDLTIYNGAALKYGADDIRLRLRNGGLLKVEIGGLIDENSTNNARLRFEDDDVDYSLINHGIINIDRIEMRNENGNNGFSGNGILNVLEDFRIQDDFITLTNSLQIDVGNDLRFENTNCELINNDTISVSGQLAVTGENVDNDNKVTNSIGSVFTIGGDFDPDNCRFVFDNFGTVNLDGNFSNGNFDPDEVQVYNRIGSTWNWGGNIFDTDVQLYCNFDSNIFNYLSGGQQNVIIPADAYWHVFFSGSGDKDLTGDIDVNGNLTISSVLDVSGGDYQIVLAGNWTNTGSFNEQNGTVFLNGNSLQSISNSAGETFFNLSISNTGAGILFSDKDVTVSGTLNMNSGNIDPNSYTLIISNNAPGAVVHNSGSVTGKMERYMNLTAGPYLFPVGTTVYENIATLEFTNIAAGSVILEFIASDPGSSGLPASDAGTTVDGPFTEGYWNLLAANGLASTDYDITLLANGFSGDDLNSDSRIVKRTDGGIWGFDGTHVPGNPPELYRTGLTGGIWNAGTGTQFCIGRTGCLKFTSHPVSQTKCLNDNVTFSVTATSSGSITGYQWQKNGVNITGETGSSLTLNNITADDPGGYACVVNADCGATGTSNTGILTISQPFPGLGYRYQKTITINEGKVKGNEDLIDFPFLFSVTDPDLATVANGGYVEHSSGYDIVFTDADGNKLDHQIEIYVETTGEYIAWIRIPVLSNDSDTEIKILYGNPKITANPSTTNTWNGNYQMQLLIIMTDGDLLQPV